MGVSEENRSLAKYLKLTFGGAPKVSRFWDEPRLHSVDILEVADRPVAGVSTYATLGLSDVSSTGLVSDSSPLRVELVLALSNAHKMASNLIAACAFNIMTLGVLPRPGTILARVFELYESNGDLKHVVLVHPFLWRLESRKLSSKTVAWLQAIPISDAERKYAVDYGDDALEDLFEKHQN